MIFRLSPSSGVPIYLQVIDQVKHAVETGALRPGDQLPTLRKMADDLAVNSNTVVRAYRDLQQEGVIELRHGSGAYISENKTPVARVSRRVRTVMESALERLVDGGLTDEEIRRLFESALQTVRAGEKHHA